MNNQWPNRIKDYGASGIYMVINLITYNYYIGKAHIFQKRKMEHFKNGDREYLDKNKVSIHRQSNRNLQKAMRRYGKDNFRFIILENVSLGDLAEREKQYLNELDWELRGNKKYFYNLCRYNNEANDRQKKMVFQYTIRGTYVKSYRSVDEAAKMFGIKIHNVRRYISHKKIFNGKHIFSYRKEKKIDTRSYRKLKASETSNTQIQHLPEYHEDE